LKVALAESDVETLPLSTAEPALLLAARLPARHTLSGQSQSPRQRCGGAEHSSASDRSVMSDQGLHLESRCSDRCGTGKVIKRTCRTSMLQRIRSARVAYLVPCPQSSDSARIATLLPSAALILRHADAIGAGLECRSRNPPSIHFCIPGPSDCLPYGWEPGVSFRFPFTIKAFIHLAALTRHKTAEDDGLARQSYIRR
jgi:hypothetical protein